MTTDHETVYTPESRVSRSLTAAKKEMWRDVKASWDLARQLTLRDINGQYRQSLLGIFWAFVPPIVTAVIFIFLNNYKIINITETEIPYPVFAIFGTTLWQVFLHSLTTPLRVVEAAKPILTKINFPKEALVLSSLGQSLFNLGIKLIILIIVFFIFKIPLTWGVPCSLLAMGILILLGLGIGLFLIPIGLLYTDVSHGLSIITTLWFFVTPAVYPPPTSFPFSLIATINPVSPILVGARDLAVQGVLHNPISFCVVTILAMLFLMVTWIMFRLSMPILIERMSA